MDSKREGVTAELYKAIVAIVDDRVKEIRVTREDFSELKSAVSELAEAQAKTEKGIGRLEDAVERLAQAQAKTEEIIEQLLKAQRELSVEVGKLSTAIGFGIEDIGRVVLPGYLERHFGIKVKELERKFFLVDDEGIELNLYSEGMKGEKGIVVLGEAKSRIYRREVKDFIKAVAKLKMEEDVFKVMFGFFIHPSASELAEEEGIVLVASYQR